MISFRISDDADPENRVACDGCGRHHLKTLEITSTESEGSLILGLSCAKRMSTDLARFLLKRRD